MHERFSGHCEGIAPPGLFQHTHRQTAGNSGTHFAHAGPEGRSRPVTDQIRRTTSPGTIENILCLCTKREEDESGSEGHQGGDEAV